jgi:DeoR family transcriptional regulator, aga operon transcriptional repressor
MDRVFVSVGGIEVARGITMIEPEEGLTFRAMIHQARQTIVVADSSKISVVAPALICPISDIHMLITDTRASDEAIAPFLERGIEVQRVQVGDRKRH